MSFITFVSQCIEFKRGCVMCGICAGIGDENQIKKVYEGLKKLEYRGYDSSGIAYLHDDKICSIKSVGQLKMLESKLEGIEANVVIGHTRWATHGKVCEENCHPHFSFDENFAIVHNGIIENYKNIKRSLNVDEVSETDTEVFVNLIATQSGDVLHKIIEASKLVEGSFAFALLSKNSEKIYLGKRGSPLYVAINGKSAMSASDMSVFVDGFEECYVLEDNEFAEVEANNIKFYDKNCKKIKKNSIFIKKYDFFKEENIDEKYFMLKEIKEQPFVLRKTFFKYFSEELLSESIIEKLKEFKQFHFIACGTAYHSALLGAKYIQDFCGKETQVSVASEFRYCKNILSKNTIYIFVSQSGETADTIASAKLVKDAGMSVMCVTNVPYCSLNNLADFVLPTFAGKEIAVASTKAYVAQVFTMLILAVRLANYDIQDLLRCFAMKLAVEDFDAKLLEEIAKFEKIYFMGRQQDYVTSLEAALKLKEIAYVNCLGIAAGELKHGTLALIDEKTLVVAISTQKNLKEKVESNIAEVKARGGKVLLVSNFEHLVEVDFKIDLLDFEECFMPIASIIPLQLLAFEYSKSLGLNPDKPRNLAKSVTVE